LLGGLLLGEAGSGGIGLGNTNLLLGNVELNVAVGGQVGGDATVGTVGTAAALDGALHDNVGDHALVSVEALGLSVSLGVDEEITDGLDGLLGPSSGVDTEDLALGVSAAVVLEVGDDLLVLQHVFHVMNGVLDQETLASTSGVVSVLVVDAQVVDLGLSG
jgi:hypothetical protein